MMATNCKSHEIRIRTSSLSEAGSGGNFFDFERHSASSELVALACESRLGVVGVRHRFGLHVDVFRRRHDGHRGDFGVRLGIRARPPAGFVQPERLRRRLRFVHSSGERHDESRNRPKSHGERRGRTRESLGNELTSFEGKMKRRLCSLRNNAKATAERKRRLAVCFFHESPSTSRRKKPSVAEENGSFPEWKNSFRFALPWKHIGILFWNSPND